MAEGLNRVMLIGNLGMDPELRFTQNGQGILRLRIATTENYVNKAKERQERTEWHTVVVWGARAEALHKILAKGRTIYIEGRIQTRGWEDKDGNKRSTTEVVATNVILLGGGRQSEGGHSRPSYSDVPPAESFGSDATTVGTDDYGDDDIPF